MTKLFGIIYILVAPTLAGICVTALLAYDQATSKGMMVASAGAAGAVVALPVAWFIARKIRTLTA